MGSTPAGLEEGLESRQSGQLVRNLDGNAVDGAQVGVENKLGIEDLDDSRADDSTQSPVGARRVDS